MGSFNKIASKSLTYLKVLKKKKSKVIAITGIIALTGDLELLTVG